jgi:hypothetical protein
MLRKVNVMSLPRVRHRTNCTTDSTVPLLLLTYVPHKHSNVSMPIIGITEAFERNCERDELNKPLHGVACSLYQLIKLVLIVPAPTWVRGHQLPIRVCFHCHPVCIERRALRTCLLFKRVLGEIWIGQRCSVQTPSTHIHSATGSCMHIYASSPPARVPNAAACTTAQRALTAARPARSEARRAPALLQRRSAAARAHWQ